ncbi:hypothetical protein FRY98_01560 [Paenibacillus faecis]|uniref:Uncharacterized protein n=1 Tax=Paenibacillus faecis TaxID=862114 RepID=A0A5D0CXG2_9BACL|nr:hypothetical protein [Paenibacillus faecis]TYA14403.1 hypothetical protein FRY98_01560 [Paenibacillus faecis]
MDNDLKELLQSVIRAELVPVNERLERIETEQQEMKQELQGIKQEQQGMKQELHEIKQELQEVKEEQLGMKQDLLEMKQDQVLIKRVVLETNDRLKNVETILENQHRIIELLSARSIQQEAELKRIK